MRASSSDSPASWGTTLIAALRALALPAVSTSTIEKERVSAGSNGPTAYSSSVAPRLWIGWSSAKSTKFAISLPAWTLGSQRSVSMPLLTVPFRLVGASGGV